MRLQRSPRVYLDVISINLWCGSAVVDNWINGKARARGVTLVSDPRAQCQSVRDCCKRSVGEGAAGSCERCVWTDPRMIWCAGGIECVLANCIWLCRNREFSGLRNLCCGLDWN